MPNEHEYRFKESPLGSPIPAASSFSNNEFVSSFYAAAQQIHKTAVEHGWWEEDRNDGEMIALMHSELSEALEGLRKDLRDDHCPEFLSVEVEFADCIIRIMDTALSRGWRVPEAILAKMAYNETRPYKHGGKKF